MHRFKARIRRYRVQPRPKVRSRRRVEFAAVLAIVLLGGAAVVIAPRLLRQMPDLSSLSELPGRLYPRAFVLEGAPETLEAEFTAALDAAPGGPAARAAALRSRYPVLRSVRVTRDWLARRLRFKVALREPLALASRDGRPRGFIAADGEVFTAPAGLFPGPLPEAELGGADAAERRRLARALAELRGATSLPSGLSRIAWAPRLDGWEVRLEDGTLILWGDLRWTIQKADRLRQVLGDARAADAGALTADLRYFEDGKIYVRPSLQASL
ncbi:MAG: cell division protein FtsQ/DivIB [Elusimicrobiota bacterium]|jgi:hypothetical protein